MGQDHHCTVQRAGYERCAQVPFIPESKAYSVGFRTCSEAEETLAESMQIQSKQAKRYQSELQAARQNAFDEATNTSFWQDKYFTCDQELRTQSRTHLAESKAYSVGFRINDG